MKRRQLILTVAIIVSGTLGYSAAAILQTLRGIDEPAAVTEERMAVLTTSACAGSFMPESVYGSIVVRVFDDPDTNFSDFEISRPPAAAKSSPCVFDYHIGHDSRIQGRTLVHFGSNGSVTRIDFYNWLDAELMHLNRPSFSVFFMGNRARLYVFETLHQKLYTVSSGDPSSISRVP